MTTTNETIGHVKLVRRLIHAFHGERPAVLHGMIVRTIESFYESRRFTAAYRDKALAYAQRLLDDGRM